MCACAHMCVCACVRACVRARARVCVCVCVCVHLCAKALHTVCRPLMHFLFPIEVCRACNYKVLGPSSNLCLYTLTLRVGHVKDMVEQFTVP